MRLHRYCCSCEKSTAFVAYAKTSRLKLASTGQSVQVYDRIRMRSLTKWPRRIRRWDEATLVQEFVMLTSFRGLMAVSLATAGLSLATPAMAQSEDDSGFTTSANVAPVSYTH